mgnify:CR=1 FL=1
MNQEYQQIAIHAEACKRFCNQIGFDWKTEDLKIDDFKEKYAKTIEKKLKAYSEYRDLQDAFGSNWPEYYKHYCVYGIKEGRSGV